MKNFSIILFIIFVIIIFNFGKNIPGVDETKTMQETKKANTEKDIVRVKQIVKYILECEEALEENKTSKLKEKSRLAEMYILSIVSNINDRYIAEIINESFFLFVLYRRLAEDVNDKEIKNKIQERIKNIDKLINKYNEKLGVEN